MLFSSFTPLGLYRLSGSEPVAKAMYGALVSQHGDQFDMTPGTRQEALCYVAALALARASSKQREGALQGLSEHVTELLPVRETEYGLTPSFAATTHERKADFARAVRRPLTWTRERISEELSSIIGAGFYAYRPTPIAEVDRFPATIGAQPMNLQRADVNRKIVVLTTAVSFIGVPVTVSYELFDQPVAAVKGSATIRPIVGERYVVEPNIYGIGETVTIDAVSATTNTFTATFTKPHSIGCLAFTHPYPSWTSTKRHSLVIVTPDVAQDPTMRRKIDRAMRRMVRGASTWAIVQSSDGITTDVFEQGIPAVSVTTLGPITI